MREWSALTQVLISKNLWQSNIRIFTPSETLVGRCLYEIQDDGGGSKKKMRINITLCYQESYVKKRQSIRRIGWWGRKGELFDTQLGISHDFLEYDVKHDDNNDIEEYGDNNEGHDENNDKDQFKWFVDIDDMYDVPIQNPKMYNI